MQQDRPLAPDIAELGQLFFETLQRGGGGEHKVVTGKTTFHSTDYRKRKDLFEMTNAQIAIFHPTIKNSLHPDAASSMKIQHISKGLKGQHHERC